jgi:hypothetical protein
MAVIYMRHPEHGAKIAISQEEAIYDETFGWSRYNPDTPDDAADDDEDELVNVMAETPRRKRRRAAQED